MKLGGLFASIPSILVVSLAGCGTVTPIGPDGGSAGTTGTGSAGTVGAAGTTGAAGTSGAAGTGGLRPCVDTLCQGACAGTSCDGEWTCDEQASCIEIAAQYCGCDGETFTASGCSPRAFAHRGPCEAGVSCDQSKILCKRLAPACPAGQVPSVEGSCYGPCVKIDSCACAAPADCPEPDHTTCHNDTKRCGPFVN